MAAALRMLDYLTDRLRRLVPQQRRSLMIAGISAVCIFALASALLVTLGLRGTPSSSSPSLALATGTATDTVTPPSTVAVTSTATTSRPTPVSVVHAPPPPPVPTHAPPPPTATPCPTATAAPTVASTVAPTNTATVAPTASVAPASAGSRQQSLGMSLSSACQSSCPTYTGNNPSQSQIRAALYTAADAYHLPRNLLLAVAWQESRWHEDVTSCDGGIGLMQLQYYTWPWLNGQSVPACGLTTTNDDPATLQGNANLGAKYLVWLSCYYSYWGNNGGASVSNPGAYTIAWYYQQAGLRYPDTKNADGTTNSKSFCAAVFNDPANPEYAALPATTDDPWSCPYSAKTGDPTLLDMTLSAYNEGPGNTNNGITNWWYVHGVEGFIPQFAAGTLPA